MSVCRVLTRLPTRREIIIELEYFSLSVRTSKLKKKYTFAQSISTVLTLGASKQAGQFSAMTGSFT